MTTQYSLPDSMKVLEGRDLDKDYEDMKVLCAKFIVIENIKDMKVLCV